MSSLLEEAIVDAKALKEAALKNAENVVLEKYSGEVRHALDTLLEQDEPRASDDMSFVSDVPYAFQNEEIDAPGGEELVEIDFDHLKARIAEEESAGIAPSIDEMATSEEVALGLEEGDVNPDIAQMENDEDAAEASTAVTAGGEKEGYLGLKEEEDIGLTEEMLADLIEELVVDMVPRPQGWAGLNSADNSIEQANNDAMADASAAHLEEEEEVENVSTAPDVVSDAALFESRITTLTVSNKELHALLSEAKAQLTRLNLENAKLVYQNKALNSTSLNERQKNQIAEAVQSANSVEEVSMIFETIQNAVGSTVNRRTRPQTLREAVQRPTSLLISSNNERNDTATSDPKMARMLRLAGLTKN
tara:strand:- start:321 stop:1409 length:1089 start_codon:yes stop_codon:yes gene_type:complete